MTTVEPIAAALDSCGTALSALARALLEQQVAPPMGPPQPVVAPDRLLTAVQAAAVLGVSKRWLYEHAGRLPFARRLSRRALRFSEAGLRRWINRQ
jgi:excisionase family DNA binding protein